MLFELNTRSFDLSGESEYKIRTFLKNKLKRGSINLSVKIDSKDQLRLNKHKLESILKSYKVIEKEYGLDLNYSHLLKNNDKRDEFGLNGFNLVQEICNSKTMSKKTLELYEKVINR